MTEKAVKTCLPYQCLGACIFAIIIAYYMYLSIQNIYWNVIISCLLGIICSAGIIIKIPLNRYVKFQADLRKGRISIPFREKNEENRCFTWDITIVTVWRLVYQVKRLIYKDNNYTSRFMKKIPIWSVLRRQILRQRILEDKNSDSTY